jgi:hypothetical protein
MQEGDQAVNMKGTLKRWGTHLHHLLNLSLAKI